MEVGGSTSASAGSNSGPSASGGADKASPSKDSAPAADTGAAKDSSGPDKAAEVSTVDRLSEDSDSGPDAARSEAVVESAGDLSAELTGDVEEADAAEEAVGEVEEGEEVAEAEVTEVAEEAEEAAADIAEALDENFTEFDADGDGYLTESEITSALDNGVLGPDEEAALRSLSGRQGFVEEMSNDEFFDENSGITMNDLVGLNTSTEQDAAIIAEQFAIEQRVARAEPVDPAQVNQPADLTAIRGTRDYYLERYEDFRMRNPEMPAPEYYLDYGLKYFDRFHENQPNMQPVTQGWIDRTGMALQVSMENARISDPAGFAALERNGEAFREFAYATHPDAYVNSGLHEVPFGDRIAIGMTPDFGDLANYAGVAQVVETGGRVLGQDIVGAGEAIGDGFNSFVAEVDRGFAQMVGLPQF